MVKCLLTQDSEGYLVFRLVWRKEDSYRKYYMDLYPRKRLIQPLLSEFESVVEGVEGSKRKHSREILELIEESKYKERKKEGPFYNKKPVVWISEPQKLKR